VHVHPAWRNHGIGADLLGHAEQRARERGFGTLALTTRTDNRAHVLYGRLGYQVVACRSSALYRRFVGAPGRVLMTKTA
jgi:GNAT superfamily N-acetyltransferase